MVGSVPAARMCDGDDEVHLESIAKRILARYGLGGREAGGAAVGVAGAAAADRARKL